jgi:hypothetical protein
VPFSGFRGQRIVIAVKLSDHLAECPVSPGTSEAFNPRMLVWWYGLAGKLTADPAGFFGHDDLHA